MKRNFKKKKGKGTQGCPRSEKTLPKPMFEVTRRDTRYDALFKAAYRQTDKHADEPPDTDVV